MSEIERVLITGVGGRTGSELPGLLKDDFSLRLTDIKQVETEFEFEPSDLADLESMRRVCRGMDAIVHLGGASWERDFESVIVPANIVGVRNVYEAARQEGVRRVVFASSFHVIGFHHVDGTESVTEEAPYRPDLMYSVSKVFGETLGRLYADRGDLSVVCLRIGYYHAGGRPHSTYDKPRRGLLLSGRDFAQLVTLSLKAPDLSFEIFNAISDSPRPRVSIEKARRMLGYEPQDSPSTIYGPDAEPVEVGDDDWEWIRVLDERHRPKLEL